jgi:hypothetical protein
MGLDVSHNAWRGSYSAFSRWRWKLAAVAGLPPLGLMDGFFERGAYDDPFKELAREFPNIAETYYDALPIPWDALKPDPLHVLLHHSDCDGQIDPTDCGPIADRLEELLPLLPTEPDPGHIGDWQEKTRKFIAGCRAAAAASEPLEFS